MEMFRHGYIQQPKNSALNFNKKFKREVLSEDDELYEKTKSSLEKA